jgi:hypothetical protein
MSISTTQSCSFPCRRFQVRAGQLFFILSLLELHNRNLMFFGKAVDRFYVLRTNLAKRGGGRNLELFLPAQEFTHIADRLKFGYVGLQEDSIQGPALEGDMIPQ